MTSRGHKHTDHSRECEADTQMPGQNSGETRWCCGPDDREKKLGSRCILKARPTGFAVHSEASVKYVWAGEH